MSKRGNNEGSIFQKNVKGHKYYIAQIYAFDENGKRKPIQISCKSHQEAVKALQKLQTKYNAGTLVFNNKATLKQWLHYFLTSCKKGKVRQTTYDNYETLARVHIYDSVIGKKQVQKITPRDLQKFISQKESELSASTIRKIHLVVSMALDRAVKESLIAINPAKPVSLPKVERPEVKPLSIDDIKHLLSVAKSHRLYPAILLELGAGLRRGELLALTWDNVNFDTGTISVTQNYVKTKIGNIMQPPKTASGKRVIAVPSSIMDKLLEHKKNTTSTKWVFSQATNPDKPISPRHFSKIFEGMAKKAGISTKFHNLRHTFASQLLEANVHMKVVQEALGHSNIQVSMNTYSHLTRPLQEEAANKLNSKFVNII